MDETTVELIDGRPASDLCDRCGHTWYEHCWHPYTECWECGLACRYFVPPTSPEQAAAEAERAAWIEARAAQLATMTEAEIQQLLRQEARERVF